MVLSQVWTTYQAWDYSASSIACNKQTVAVGVSTGPILCQTSQKTVPSPYGLYFDWTPEMTGTASFTWPTAIVTTSNTCPGGGNICQIWTLTGTKTVTLWTNSKTTVTATLAGPTNTVTQGIGTMPNATSTSTSWPTTGACKIAGFPVPDWFCKTSFGVANWLWISIGILAVLVIAFLLSRRKSGNRRPSK